MAKKKKTVSFEYKNKSGEKLIGFITPKKARSVESFKEHAKKRAKREGIPLPEEENEERKEVSRNGSLSQRKKLLH